MQITPPFGYGEIVPLKKTHRVLMTHGATPSFCRSINALALSSSEFTAAGRDYPIVFSSPDAGKSFAPLAVLGLKSRQNVFITQAGEWDPAVYLPAFVRRYPFCLSKLYVDGKPRSERVVCVASEYLDKSGRMLYDRKGGRTPHWAAMEQLLTDYENDLDRTAAMCANFNELGLFEQFTMQAIPNRGEKMELKGMFRISETKLAALAGGVLAKLIGSGLMGKAYAHLHSLENFIRLLDRAEKTPPRDYSHGHERRSRARRRSS